MSSTDAQAKFHQDGQFVIRLPLDQRIAPEASTWMGTEETAMRKEPKQTAVPQHPIPAMQDAFAESLAEVNDASLGPKPKLRTGDVAARRELLLDQDKSEGPPAALWRFRPEQKCHELRKLMAQISFGVYLLLNGMANSNAQVVAILQGHIDEVDEFLEMTMEDFKVATEDLTKRLDYLKLPMDNVEVFEQMLEDRAFRLQIVEGNIKIEHILSRTTTALMQSVQDISEGLRSTREFSDYLAKQQSASWRQTRPDVIDIFSAMKGNTDGWLNAFVDLEGQSNTLNALIVELNMMVAEMEKKAGEVSRRTRFSIQPFTGPAQSPRSSRASSIVTPPASPGPQIPTSPPRLSLRFSTVPEDGPSGSTYFGLTNRASFFPRDSLPAFQYTPAQTPDSPKRESVVPKSPERSVAHQESKTEVKAEKQAKPMAESDPGSEGEVGSDSDTSSSPVEEDQPESPAADTGLYILQPRTYTPLPPAPLPSPRLIERLHVETEYVEKEVVLPAETVNSSRTSLPAIQEKSQLRKLSAPRFQDEARILHRASARVKDESQPQRQSSVRIDEEPKENERDSLQPRQRTSLRQRVSLRTTPPHSIQVPPPDAPELQRPIFASPKTYQNYRTFTGPDSAYGSDIDRAGVKSYADPSTSDFSPPVLPRMVPSPHSDQQYFRPVKASPHSPLQQRPHTAGHGTPRPYHQRNAPSAMGMSMLSTVSTLNPDAPKDRTLKKKRSAFGWLKKAFTLDEEERAAFDQRKKEVEQHNPYYDGKSPMFLDGRRIR